jgi:hypothetical protein
MRPDGGLGSIQLNRQFTTRINFTVSIKQTPIYIQTSLVLDIFQDWGNQLLFAPQNYYKIKNIKNLYILKFSVL